MNMVTNLGGITFNITGWPAMAVIVTFTSTCNTNLKQFHHHGYIVLFESRMFAVFFVEAIID